MLLNWTPAGGLGQRSTLPVGGLGADGRGFQATAVGCVGELRRSLGAEVSRPIGADVRRPFGAEVSDGA